MASNPDRPLSAAQCRGARAMLAWTMEELSHRSGLSRRTLVSFESERRIPHAQNLKLIEGAFGDAGIRFLSSEAGEGVFVSIGDVPQQG